MDLLLIRHARAEDPETFAAGGRADDQRPLTEEGRRRMKKAAYGLKRLVPSIEVLATSPLLRARQTVELVQDVYGGAISTVTALAPGGNLNEVVTWVAEQEGDTRALVGHEPDLGHLAAMLLTGRSSDFLPFKKGAVCAIRFRGSPCVHRGELRWLLTAPQLALIAERK
jgi:phosphohistidine phosphatase